MDRNQNASTILYTHQMYFARRLYLNPNEISTIVYHISIRPPAKLFNYRYHLFSAVNIGDTDSRGAIHVVVFAPN